MAKLTTPIRVVVLLTAIAVLTILLLANAVGASQAAPAGGVYGEHLVVSGDTLWDIAAEHTAQGEDVRRVVFEIQSLNDLDGSVILPGQVLRVPLPG